MALGEDPGEVVEVCAFKVDGAHGVALDCCLPWSGDGGEEGEAGLGDERDDYCEQFRGKVEGHCGFYLDRKVILMNMTLLESKNSMQTNKSNLKL